MFKTLHPPAGEGAGKQADYRAGDNIGGIVDAGGDAGDCDQNGDYYHKSPEFFVSVKQNGRRNRKWNISVSGGKGRRCQVPNQFVGAFGVSDKWSRSLPQKINYKTDKCGDNRWKKGGENCIDSDFQYQIYKPKNDQDHTILGEKIKKVLPEIAPLSKII